MSLQKRTSALASLLVLAMTSPVAASGRGAVIKADPNTHFDPQGQQPSAFTIEAQKQIRAELPFTDKRDFEESRRGFIAAPPYRKIMADTGQVAWDIGSYDWLLNGQDFDSINPSLQRHALLNMAYGLYEVVPDKIYQVRGFDLANITFIKGDTGWIVFDPLTAKETARAALSFINDQLGERPVVAVVYSHSHADHFGGVRGVVNEEDVRSGQVKVIAPEGFLKHAVSENIYAGNAMARRMYYQYGTLLPRHPNGHVDQAIGKNTAAGNLGLIAPNTIITGDFEELTIDGVPMVFQSTPDTEAPAEMNTWFPTMKAFWAAENIVATVHNIYTLRGAQVRDALNWSKQINEALYRFGKHADVMFAAHTWPRWGNSRIQEVIRTQRDAYAHLNNQVLHLANQGVTINEVQNVYQLPESLKKNWAARSYHGSEPVNSRAVINRYIGYWDGNPVNLDPLSPKESAPLYVEMMGGAQRILNKATGLYQSGDYKHAAELLNKLIFADPNNVQAKALLADVYEQLGYQEESTSLRNSYLAGAYELRNGIPLGNSPTPAGPDMISALPTELWLDFLGIRLDTKKAKGKSFVINLITPDNNETYAIELSNSTLTNIRGQVSGDANLTITVNRTDLEKVMIGSESFDAQIASGKVKLEGDPAPYRQLRDMLVVFKPDFEILPGTSRISASSDDASASHPFRIEPRAIQTLTD